ncbi:MAG: 3-oxoacyl-[acyl-carrier-protein] reductase [Marinilabiliales bacterium]
MILIAGASRGIGKYLLETFINNGEEVSGTYLHTLPTEHLKKYYFKVDVEEPTTIVNWKNKFGSGLKNIVLINCVGINYNSYAHKADLKEWERVVRVNLTGVFNVIHTFLPLMREQKYGRIINFSSVVARLATPGASAYAASKAGLWGLVKSIAAENASLNITINNLNLGYFNIGMIEQVPEDYKEKIIEKIPAGKLGNPENIYSIIKNIIDNDYINASSIDINGGLL